MTPHIGVVCRTKPGRALPRNRLSRRGGAIKMVDNMQNTRESADACATKADAPLEFRNRHAVTVREDKRASNAKYRILL
jgi:hypothetical protein